MGGSIWLIGRRGKTIEALGVSADMKNNREKGEGIDYNICSLD